MTKKVHNLYAQVPITETVRKTLFISNIVDIHNVTDQLNQTTYSIIYIVKSIPSSPSKHIAQKSQSTETGASPKPQKEITHLDARDGEAKTVELTTNVSALAYKICLKWIRKHSDVPDANGSI